MDEELNALRERVDCRTVLERAGWELDPAGSSAGAAKYRGGPARIVVVTHHGKGWFDPLADARGDVIALAQHLWGGSLGHARKALRQLAGIAPAAVAVQRAAPVRASLDAAATWDRACPPAPGTAAWVYLADARGLPEATIWRAVEAGVLREGIRGTCWALHRTGGREPCGWEMRGPQYKGFSKGGTKALFWVGEPLQARRVAVTESAIDALSLATIEGWAEGTAYLSTGGGFGPRTAQVLGEMLSASARLVGATDQGQGGDLLADRLRAVASTACASFGRLRPIAKDWNAQLTGRE